MKKPHILFLLTDQFRYDAYSSSPAARQNNLTTPDTPSLDFIASRGATFSRAYASTPTCTPSRAAILTGRSPWDHGMLGYNMDVSCSNYTTTLPQVLDSSGYRTSAIGKVRGGVCHTHTHTHTHRTPHTLTNSPATSGPSRSSPTCHG